MPQTIRVPLSDVEPVAHPSVLRVPRSAVTLAPPVEPKPAVAQPADRAALTLSKAKTIGAPPKATPASFLERVRDLGVSTAKGVIGIGESAVGLLDIPTGGRAGQFVERHGLWSPKDVHAALDTHYSEAAKREGLTVRQAQGAVNKAITALKNPHVIANAVAQSAPLMLGGAGAARTLVARGVPTVTAAAVGEGAVTAGLTAEQIRQQSPEGRLTPGQAALATGAGVTTGLLGAFGATFAKAVGVADVDTLLAGAVRSSSARRNVVDVVKRVGAAGAIEGWVEEFPQSAQEQIAQNIATGKPWHEGVTDEAILGALAGSVMSGGAQIAATVPAGPRRQPAEEPLSPTPISAPPVAVQAPAVAPARPGATPAGTITVPVSEVVPVEPPAAPGPPVPAVAAQTPPSELAPAVVPVAVAGERPPQGTRDVPVEAGTLPERPAAAPAGAPVAAVRIVSVHREGVALEIPERWLQGRTKALEQLGMTPRDAYAHAIEDWAVQEQEERNAAARAEAVTEPPARTQPEWVAAGREMERRVRAGISPTGVERRAAVVDVTPLKAEREEHSYSSTQVNLPQPMSDAVVTMAKAIPDEDIAEDGRAGDSEATAPHVTVKYGLHTTDVEKVRKVLKDEPPITVTLGATSLFTNDEADVLKIDVDSPDLHRINAKIAEALETTDTHPDYKPHVTIAYVKPGKGKTYEGDERLKGQTVTLDAIRFSTSDGKIFEIPLTGTKARQAGTQEPVRRRTPRALRLLTAQQISDFRPGIDRIERRGDRTFVVDTMGERAAVEVVHDALTPEAIINLRRLSGAQREGMTTAIRGTPYLSLEGKAERLALLDESEDEGEGPSSVGMPRGGPLVPGQPSGTLQRRTATAVRPQDIAAKMSQAFSNLPIAVGKLHPSNRGVFKNPTGVIRTQLGGDYYAIFHEFGHALDLMVTRWSATNKRGALADELVKLGAPTSRPKYTLSQRRKEGVAEYVRRWLMEPAAVRAEAPEFTRAFEAFIARRDRVGQALADAQQRTQQYLSLSPAEQFDLMVDYGDRRVPEVAEKIAAWAVGTEGDPRTAFDRLVSAGSDDLYRLWQMEVDLKQGRPQDPGESTYWLVRTLRGAPGKALAFLHGPVTDTQGKTLGPGLYAALQGRMDKYRDIAAYMVAKRAERAKTLGLVSGFTDDQIAAKLAAVGQDPEVVQGAKDIATFRRGFLDYLEDRGLLTKDLRAIWEKRWGDTYIPFHRIGGTIRESTGSGGSGRLRQNARFPFRRFTGSMLAITDPIRGMVEDTFKSVAAAEENYAMNEVLDLAKLQGGGRWIEAIPADQAPVRFNLQQLRSDILAELKDNGIAIDDSVLLDDAFLDRMVTVWMPHTHTVGAKHYITALGPDGKRTWAQVHDEGLWQDLITVGPQASGAVVRLLRPAASLLRSTATLNLPFMVRNVIRDIAAAKVYSPSGYNMKNLAGGLYSMLTKDDAWHRFMTSGAAQATFNAQDRNVLKRELQRLDKAGVRKFLDMTVFHPFDGLAALRELTENATRVGAVKRELAKAGALDETVMRRIGVIGREVTQDFQKMGHSVREWNRVTAFLGARIGGWTRFSEAVKAHPRQVATRLTPYAALAMALWYLHQDDDEYEEIDGWEKGTYHHIPVPQALRALGWGPFVRFPRPFEFGDLANWLEAALDWQVKDDPKVVDRLPFQGSKDLAWQLTLLLAPNLLLPALEVGANYDTFRERAIVSPFDHGLAPELQYNRWTSETAKQIGGLIGMAPAKVDHLIYGYTTGIGREVTTRIDELLSASGAGPARPSRGARDLPAVSALYTGAALSTSSASVNQFYLELERLEGAAASVHRYVNSGDEVTAAQTLDEAGLDIEWRGRQMTVTSPRLKALREGSRQLKALRGEIDAVYRHPRQTPTQKADALNELALEMTNLARAALGQSELRRTPRASAAATAIAR